MLEKYFNGVIEQTIHRVGDWEKNIVIAQYSNDFSIQGLESISHYQKQENQVYFTAFEFDYTGREGAYEPFLQIICQGFRTYAKDQSFETFLDQCHVYDLHKEIILDYYEDRVCTRKEKMLLGEVTYEQKRMTKAISQMLRALAKLCPIVIIINRFQLAGQSTMAVVEELLKEPSKQIGMVLAVNDEPSLQSSTHQVWTTILENLDDENRVYHMGDSGKSRVNRNIYQRREINWQEETNKIHNMIYFLDFELAASYLEEMDALAQIQEEEPSARIWFEMKSMQAYAGIFRGELSIAIEALEEMQQGEEFQAPAFQFQIEYLTATTYMYQGKLQKSMEHLQICKEIARSDLNEDALFEAELLEIETKMSGWYNIFFCVQDVEIREEFLEKLMEKNYRNHLAHVYIYAFDNGPEVVAKAYRSEAALVYFTRGVEIAKRIDNVELICNAYQKNLMIAAANGMFETAVIYSIRIYQALPEDEDLSRGRIFSGLGYNLCALGESERADLYYKRALQTLYHLRMPEDIAEVHYNMALNYIQVEKFEEAEHYLLLCMKAIERLHLNSLRVANLSKLYALLALVSILLGDRFNSERYLMSCRQFLNYIMERENNDIGIIHDYTRCDDDLFLYTFTRGILNQQDGKLDEAMECFLQAEKYMMNSEGNQFFAVELFRKKRMDLFQTMGRSMLYEIEEDKLKQHKELSQVKFSDNLKNLLNEMEEEISKNEVTDIPEELLENLMKQEGLALDLQNNRRQMEFISNWQKQIDVTTLDTHVMVEQAIRTFLNHFNIDCALYVRYHRGLKTILYNNTEIQITDRMLETIEKTMKEYPQGFAISKISANYFEYESFISLFGEDKVCSIVAVPFFKEHHLQSILITYILMKENWHSSIERYMLTDDDLHIYKLLFQEMSYSINRMEAYETVYEINRKLSQVAVTDNLTGTYNRSGMYQEIKRKLIEVEKGQHEGNFGLMFIDLDNFKNYNDTFGHNVGDAMLVEMTRIFQKAVGHRGFVSRYGGDEFILILDTSKRLELEQIAQDIFAEIARRQGFKEEISKLLGKEVTIDEKEKLSCSIGISMAEHVTKESDIQEMMKKADRMLYAVKEGTKGTYAFT